MKKMNGGTLHDIFTVGEDNLDKLKVIPFYTRISWMLDLALALKMLHKKNITHCDLKADNIFIHENALKLGDFGVSFKKNKND